MLNAHWNTIRRITIFFLSSLFLIQFVLKISAVVDDESKCVCAYDGYGYYMYLNRFFEHGDLKLNQQEAEKKQNLYCDSAVVYQLYTLDNGNQVNIYQMGQAFVELPAYTIGEVFARGFGYKTDGFSKPYHIAFLLNGLCFILLGIRIVNKICKIYFNDSLTSLLLVLIFLGTNYWCTAVNAFQLQHILFLSHSFYPYKPTKVYLVCSFFIGINFLCSSGTCHTGNNSIDFIERAI